MEAIMVYAMDSHHGPATSLIGVQCIVCSTPLTDAKSAELGIGPVCRKKWGYDDEIPGGETSRKRANRLVYEATVAKRDNDVEHVLKCADEIHALGLVRLAARIRERFIDLKLIDVEHDGQPWCDVYTLYRPDWPFILRRTIPAKYLARVHVTGKDADGDPIYKRGPGSARDLGGKFDHWCVHANAKRLVLAVLVRFFPGQRCVGSKGVFTIPDAGTFRVKYADEPYGAGHLTKEQHEDLLMVFK